MTRELTPLHAADLSAFAKQLRTALSTRLDSGAGLITRPPFHVSSTAFTALDPAAPMTVHHNSTPTLSATA